MKNIELFARSFAREFGKTLAYWIIMGPLLILLFFLIDEAAVFSYVMSEIANLIKGN